MIEQAIEMLKEQQSKVKERSAPWMVAEQLKDICRREPESAELLAKDLENPQMGIVQAEKKIKSFADGHKTGGFSCVTPLEAEEILEKLLAEDACFSLRQLAVNGRDLLALGLSGPAVGRTLDALLDAVVNGELPNEPAALLDAARRLADAGGPGK